MTCPFLPVLQEWEQMSVGQKCDALFSTVDRMMDVMAETDLMC
jgi:hypothetical protein